MGCKLCKRKKIAQQNFQQQYYKNSIEPGYNILDSNENESTDTDSNNSIIIIVHQEFKKDKEKECIFKIKEEKGKKEEIIDEAEEEEEEEQRLLMPYQIVLKDYLDKQIDGAEVFEKNWYNDLEKDKIVYSKRSIIAMINAAFDDKSQEFKELYNKDPLKIAVKSNGSFITDKFQVMRSIYTVNKNIYPPNTSIRMISKYLNYIKERSSWDSQLKLYKIIEGNEEGKEVKCIVHNWLKSPMFLVSERDVVEKRYEFYHKGRFYFSESSVNDDYCPFQDNVTRIYDLIFIEELYEENDNIILKAITQIDAKVNLPQAMVNATLSNKLLDFYNGLAKAMNKDYKEGKLVFEDNEGNIIENNNLN